MKKYELIIFCIFSMFTREVFSQNDSQNHIVSTTFLDETGTRKLDVVSYYDGLGRETQTVQKNVTCTQGDLVSCKDYDAMGRVCREWMPLPFSNNNGDFIQSSVWTDRGADEPYTKIIYEPSSLGRVLNTWGVGAEWHRRKGIENKYLVNDNSDLLSAVCFEVENDRLKKKGKYKNSELYVEYTSDEDEREIYVFKDKSGNLILERRVDGSECVDTYYVYDERGNLRFVLPPLAADALASTADGLFEVENDNVLGKYAYVYKYDSRNRCNYKKFPGCAGINMAYDVRGNLIFTDNGELRKKRLMEFYRYDKYDRIVMRGVISSSGSVWGSTRYHGTCESYTGNTRCYGYSNSTGLNIKPENIHEVYYYDDYSFLNLFGDRIDSLSYKPKEGYGVKYVNGEAAHLSSNGLQTGHLKKVIDDDDKLFISALYYDNKKRLVQSRTNNYMGGYDCYYYQYDYVGNVLRQAHNHSNPADALFGYEEVYTYGYDAAKRLTDCRHKLKSGQERLLYRNSYDEYGRVIEKSYTEKCKTTYAYNMRNQLTGIQADDLYSQTYTFTNGGNIERTDWYCDYVDFRHTYAYTYDKLDRLVSAKHTANDDIASQFVDYQEYDGEPIYDVSYEYDKHGNITRLQRLGYTGEYLVRSLDDLTYRYDGNRLMAVEAADNDQYVSTFEDEVHEAEECSYDLNGNLVKDNNRNLQNIDYNYLNLPQQIYYGKQDAGKVISYTYATDGTKLKSLYATGTNDILSPIGTLDSNMDNDIVYSDSVVYCDNSLYVKGRLDRILLPDGYIQVTYQTIRGRLVAFYKYYYLMKDHQGSARINISEEYLDDRPSEGCRKAVSYYPFGKAMTGWTKWVNPFKEPYTYTGKKEETMHGLGWYDYGKRFYDPNYRLSFISVDPLCEKYYSISPYAYCANNPIRYVNLQGDSLSMTMVQVYDAMNSTNYAQTTIADLQSQTGLTLSISATTGQVTYAKDANQNPVVTSTTDSNGNIIQVGSATARNALISAISKLDFVNVAINTSNNTSGVSHGSNDIWLSPNQINSFITGSTNIDNRTLGWGMTFMHELHHTQVGGGLHDTPGNPGPVVIQMNIIHSELNAQGGNYGQRLDYGATSVGSYNYIPFDISAQNQLSFGFVPLPINKFLKFK